MARHTLQTPDGAALHYLTLGRGPVPLVVIPGAGDGQDTLERTAWRLSLYFRPRRERYRLLVFSRRQPVPMGFSLDGHARDLLWLLEHIGWGPSVWECNSAGGPVGQAAAARRPDLVRGLILSCTLHRSNPTTTAVVEAWLRQIAQRRWAEFQWSSLALTFRPATVRRYRWARPLLRLTAPPPRDPARLRHVLQDLLDFDHRPLLPAIGCPALVVGGEDDQIIPAEVQREMAGLLPRATLRLYPGYGHGNDQENPAYEQAVSQFVGQVLGVG
jgi:pimeloyl-ACP methyl ester carboxylesterase